MATRKPPKSKRARKNVVEKLVTEYSSLATTTAFTELQLQAIFTEAEMKTVNDLLLEIKSATTENKKKAALVANIDKYSGVVLKMLRKLGGVPV